MAKHIGGIEIESYRGIKNLQLSKLTDINLITGDNNCGKTSVLEVISSLKNPMDPNRWADLTRKDNQLSLYDAMESLFDMNKDEKNIKYRTINQLGLPLEVELTGQEESLILTDYEIQFIKNAALRHGIERLEETIENQKTQLVKKLYLEFLIDGALKNEVQLFNFENRFTNKSRSKQDCVNTVYISPFQHTKGNLYLTDVLNHPELYEEMIEVLREFDEGILSINADKSENQFLSVPVYKILSKNHEVALPLNVYGDGMKKAILLMSAVVKAKNGILLLDEFETAIHTSAMEEVFNWILNACMKLNVQVFLTSHSEEAINKVLKIAPNLSGDLNVITLYKNPQETVARVLDLETAIEVRNDLGLELR